MVTITTTSGRENFPTGSATVGVFVLPCAKYPVARESAIGLAARAPEFPLRAVGVPTKVAASPTRRADIAGEWTTCAYDVQEGAILKVAVNKSSSNFGSMRTMANAALRARATAPYIRMSIPLTGSGARSTVLIEGRFDIIPVEEALALGAPIPIAFRPSFDPVHQRRAFDVVEMEPGIAKPVQEVRTVSNEIGDRVEVIIPRRRRAMAL